MAKFCKKCGNQLKDNEMFCTKCGTRFEEQPAMPAVPEKKKSPVKAIIAVVLVVAILGGGFAFWKLDPLSLFGKAEVSSDTDGENEDKESSREETNEIYSEENNVNDKIDNDENDMPSDNSEIIKTFSVGDVGTYLTFGKYEQDNDTSNGKEDIEWLVLAKEDGKALLISKYALDCKKFNEDKTDVTWETCTLRAWLNSTFINEAFSSLEQSIILTTTVTADNNFEYDTDPGNDTNDKMFLLSVSEVNKYFSSDDQKNSSTTAYAIAQGAYSTNNFRTASGEPTGYWTLRTPGYSRINACYVGYDGHVDNYGLNVDGENGCIRPAMWVNL